MACGRFAVASASSPVQLFLCQVLTPEAARQTQVVSDTSWRTKLVIWCSVLMLTHSSVSCAAPSMRKPGHRPNKAHSALPRVKPDRSEHGSPSEGQACEEWRGLTSSSEALRLP